jgi:hypothetical protein
LPARKDLTFEITKNGCFEVTSHAPDRDGYHLFHRDGDQQRIHRYIYEECFGVIAPGLVVIHKCDNPHCINPEHLTIGTQGENVYDAVRKGRNAKGYNVGLKGLTEEEVRKIKKSLGQSNTELAKRYGVAHQTISKIRNGVSWKWVN